MNRGFYVVGGGVGEGGIKLYFGVGFFLGVFGREFKGIVRYFVE